MKITVRPYCEHPDGVRVSGNPYTGQHAVISPEGVILDGRRVVWRDRRMKKNREAGHPWLAANGIFSHTEFSAYTDFTVTVEP